MNSFHFVILDAWGHDAHFYWRSGKETVEEVTQEISEHFNQLPMYVEAPVFVERLK